MPASSADVIFQKTFEVLPGAKLDKIYQNSLTVQGAYKALIGDADTKKIIGGLPILGCAFFGNALELLYPTSGGSAHRVKLGCGNNCKVVLKRDAESYDYVLSLESRSSTLSSMLVRSSRTHEKRAHRWWRF
ncbi:hypothetical protein [Wolbachia endosymbiont of Ctenocephalides felis wCfeT]|uniref:hypothetical protein n=1 Tax=Wolbachia endosymbiont of Ctenocephalides felis wCfeT TaxID=2732593 RepID=UPI001446002E|nr:hypothetical protein [Wolbachia endosymbiont of Ctenocephalides felis wCfeT]